MWVGHGNLRMFPVFITFCAAQFHTVGFCISFLAALYMKEVTGKARVDSALQ